jgi:hypothetical protein
MLMATPAFIVDGFTELKIVQKLCPNTPIQRTDLNGKRVTLEAIANKISQLVRLYGNRHYPIIVLIDKEDRNISFNVMSQAIQQLLDDAGLTDQDIRVCVADRMIENWILADWECFCKDPRKVKPKKTDGLHGTAEIKKIKGRYNKTTDGVELFTANSPEKMYANSESFKHFVDTLDGIPCNFLNFDKPDI